MREYAPFILGTVQLPIDAANLHLTDQLSKNCGLLQKPVSLLRSNISPIHNQYLWLTPQQQESS